MYNSSYTAREVLEILRGDVDISLDISDAQILMWLTSIEQMLYAEIICEQRFTRIPYDGAIVKYAILNRGAGEAVPEARDIVAVFADDIELQRVSGGVGAILHGDRGAWYDAGDEMQLMLPVVPQDILVAHIVRPERFLSDKASDTEVHVPAEFIPMILARLRGEMYKVCNEDNLAAKWLMDYNTEIENFKIWAVRHGRKYGV